MSRLDDLIKEYCPDGVEYKKLRDVASISRGGSFQKKDFVKNGFPCIHYGQIYTLYGLFTDKTVSFISEGEAIKQRKAVKNDLIMAVTSENIEDVCKCVAWLGEGEVAVSGHTAIIHHSLDPKYLTYYLHSSMFYAQKVKLVHGTKVMEVKPDSLGNIELPVPPVEVQREIVRILDDYTAKTEELKVKLSAELSARRKQYEFYREELLSFDTDVKRLSIGDCTEKTQNVKWKKTEGDYEYIDLSSVDREMSTIIETTTINASSAPSRAQQIVNTDDILFGTTRPLLKRYCMIPPKYNNQIASTGFCVLRAKRELILPRYLYYIISSDAFYKHIEPLQVDGSYPSVTNSNVKSYAMAVPSLSEQARIVNVLDSFEAMCNNLKTGLPAEIEARQKQYEYYRDKLLTFEEKKAI